MNDFMNYNITIPKNLEDLFQTILKIVDFFYEKHTPQAVKSRRNKKRAKMTDSEIITVKILIECLKMSENKGYHFLKSNFPNLVNYIDRTRFNRTINSLLTVVKEVRKQIAKMSTTSVLTIVDSFPIPVCKFGRALFTNTFKGIATYGYCASKKETYFGFKGHLLVDVTGNPIDIIVTKANVDDREGLYELSEENDFDKTIADKGYIGSIEEDFKSVGKELIALKRKNSKNKLPKNIHKTYSTIRRRIETTISQLVEIFDIEKVRKTSMMGFLLEIETKILSFNILRLINQLTNSSKPTHIAALLFYY